MNVLGARLAAIGTASDGHSESDVEDDVVNDTARQQALPEARRGSSRRRRGSDAMAADSASSLTADMSDAHATTRAHKDDADRQQQQQQHPPQDELDAAEFVTETPDDDADSQSEETDEQSGDEDDDDDEEEDEDDNSASDGDAAHEDDHDGQGHDDSDDNEEQEEISWISWFCGLAGHEVLCEVDVEFVDDFFNLTGLNAVIPCFDMALNLIRDAGPEENLPRAEMEEIEGYAELLYLLIHQRFICTSHGLKMMAEMYQNATYGTCPRVYCRGQACLPVGVSDQLRCGSMMLYCPRCNDMYESPSAQHRQVDGAAFGTTAAHMLLLTNDVIYSAMKEIWRGMTVAYESSDEDGDGDDDQSGSDGGNSRIDAMHDDDSDISDDIEVIRLRERNKHAAAHRKNWWEKYRDVREGESYIAKIFGFRIHPSSQSGPRMTWLRQRRKLSDSDESDDAATSADDAANDNDDDIDEHVAGAATRSARS